MHAYSQHLDAPLTAAVGGLFAYWAGTLQRAPKLYRRTGFEWLHIMLMQPRKVGRYLVGNPVFLFRMVRWMRTDRLSRAIRDASEQIHGLLVTFGALAFLCGPPAKDYLMSSHSIDWPRCCQRRPHGRRWPQRRCRSRNGGHRDRVRVLTYHRSRARPVRRFRWRRRFWIARWRGSRTGHGRRHRRAVGCVGRRR